MIQIRKTIVDVLKENNQYGLSEDQLLNYVAARMGAVEKPVHFDDYTAAKDNLNEKIVEREIVMKEVYGGPEKKVMRLFWKD
jgi:hypothetical protein